MKKETLKRCVPGSPEYVVLHAYYKKGRYKRPSLSYKGEKNPRKALLLAKADARENHENAMKDLIVSVEMQNDRSNMVRIHMPSLGPYTDDNPCICLNCGRPGEEWTSSSEACPA